MTLISYNTTKNIDFNQLGEFSDPVSEFVFNTFSKGYLTESDFFLKDWDWADLIPLYPILIFMFIFVAVVFIVGLIVFWCWYRHRMKKRNDPNDQTREKPRSVRYAVVSLVLVLIILFCCTTFWSASSIQYDHKVKKMRDYILKNLEQPTYFYSFDDGTHRICDADDNIYEEWRDEEGIKAACLPKLENAMTRIKNINNNIYLISISIMDWIDEMRFLQRKMIRRGQQSQQSENVLNKLHSRTLYYSFKNLSSLLEIESAMDKLEHIMIKLMDNVRPKRDISAEVDRMNSRYNPDYPDRDEPNTYASNCHAGGGGAILNTYQVTESMPQLGYVSDEYASLPFLGYLLILLICIGALLGVIYDAVSKPRCNFFFLITICMISLLSGVILVSVLWHFLTGATLYSALGIYEKYFEKNREISNSRYSNCETVMKNLNFDYLKRDYHTLLAYVNSSVQHQSIRINSSTCQLNRLRRSRSNKLHFSEFGERSDEMKEDCKRLHEIFEGNFSNFLNQCQKNRQNFKSVYFGEINKPMRDTLKVASQKVPKEPDDVSVIRWMRVLKGDYPISLAAVWVPICITVLLLPLLIWPLWFLSKHPVHIPKQRKESTKTAINQSLPDDDIMEEENKEPAPAHPPNASTSIMSEDEWNKLLAFMREESETPEPSHRRYASISSMSEDERKQLLEFTKLTKEEAPRLRQRYSRILEENQTGLSSTADSMPSPTEARNSMLTDMGVEELVRKHMIRDRFVISDDTQERNELRRSAPSIHSVAKRTSRIRSSETSQRRDKPSFHLASSTQQKPNDCSCRKKASSQRAFSARRSKQAFSDTPNEQLFTTPAPRLRSNSTTGRLSEPHHEPEHSEQANSVTMNRGDSERTRNENSQDLNNQMCRAFCNDIVTNITRTDRNTHGNENSNLGDNAHTETLVSCQARQNPQTKEGREPRKLHVTVSMQWRSESPRKEK